MNKTNSTESGLIKKVDSFSNTISSLIGFLGLVSIVFGVIVSRSYLLDINQDAILPDILASVPALSSLLFVFIVLTIFIFLGFFSIHITFDESKKRQIEPKNNSTNTYNSNSQKRFNIFKLSIFLITLVSVFFIYNLFNDSYLFYIFVIFFTVFYCLKKEIISCTTKYKDNMIELIQVHMKDFEKNYNLKKIG